MIKFIFISLLAFSSVIYAKEPVCELCVKIEKIAKAYQDDERKAYDAFNELLSKVQFNKDKKIRSQELIAVIKTSVLLEKSDERWELPQYLVSVAQEHPADFKEALGSLSKADRKKLEQQIQEAKKLIEKGEEP